MDLSEEQVFFSREVDSGAFARQDVLGDIASRFGKDLFGEILQALP